MKAKIVALFLITLLFGCINPPPPTIEGGKNHTVVVKDTSKEQTPYNKSYEKKEEEKRDIGNITIIFFNIYSEEPLTVDTSKYAEITSQKKKDGRLILIKKGTKELVIWSVPSEKFDEATNLIKGEIDGPLEYLLFPSGYPTTAETANEAIKKLKPLTVIKPNYEGVLKEIKGNKVEKGDVIKLDDVEIYILSPIPNRFNSEEGNSITFELLYNNKKALFLLDANPALTTVIYDEVVKKSKEDYYLLELPLYGRGTPSSQVNLNLIREANPDIIIVEGAPLSNNPKDPYEDRVILRFIKEILKKTYNATWNGDIKISW